MGNGRFKFIPVVLILTLILGSCSGIRASTGKGGNNDASESPSASSTQESASPTQTVEQETPKATEEATPAASESAQPSPSADANQAEGSIVPIQMSETGMVPLPVSDLNGAEINPRIVKLVNEPWDWNDDDIKNGIDQYNNVFVIYARYPESIAGKLKLGSDFAAVQEVLGKPGYAEEMILAYKTAGFYIAFFGDGKADYAAFMPVQVKDYDDAYMKGIIEELNSESFSTLESSMEKLDKGLDFFYERGSNDGQTYYAHSLYGISVSDEEEPIIDVFNNYEGTLYIQKSGYQRFSIAFNNFDTVVLKLRDTLSRYYNLNGLLDTEGILSSDGKLKAVYSDADHLIIVRTLDNSIQDRYVYGFFTGGFYWLGTHYLLYADDISGNPEYVDINDSMPWGESVPEKAGLPAGQYTIKSVTDKVITFDDGNGNTSDVGYDFDSEGKISFTVK